MKPNKVINLQFEINERGHITAIYGGQLPPEYIASVIKCAQAEIEAGILLNTETTPAHELLPPGDRIINDAEYILSGGRFTNLASEDL